MRCSTPRTMCPMHHENMATVLRNMNAMGSAKAYGSMGKPIYGSEPPRATRARDKETQSMANFLVHPTRH
jgi:hypothetical protein